MKRADEIARGLRELADPDKARGMAAYMKTSMPFFGVQKDARAAVVKRVLAAHPLASGEEWVATALALWRRPHREEKYAALDVAMRARKQHGLGHLDLFERLIREGAWWDFVDDVAVRMVGPLLLAHRAAVQPRVDRWISDEDMWIRRSAIICQNKHREATDEKRLFDYCRRCAHEKEFFIRKAIGWALREYAYARPERVRAFLAEMDGKLSGLSVREASKHL